MYVPFRLNVENLILDEKSGSNKLILDDLAFFNEALKILFTDSKESFKKFMKPRVDSIKEPVLNEHYKSLIKCIFSLKKQGAASQRQKQKPDESAGKSK